MIAELPKFGGMGLGAQPLTGCKAKPIGKVLLFALYVAEPLQIAYLGGSSMNWVRFMAETHHNFGHLHIRWNTDPERSMTVMSDEEFLKRSR